MATWVVDNQTELENEVCSCYGFGNLAYSEILKLWTVKEHVEQAFAEVVKGNGSLVEVIGQLFKKLFDL